MLLPPLLFCDIETTSLDEKEGRILEIALALTDDYLAVESTIEVVLMDLGGTWDEEARKLHDKTGLLKECRSDSALLHGDAENKLIEWVKRHNATGLYMAGSGIGFDRRWLSLKMPDLHKLWHYRNFDVTTLRYFYGTKKPDPPHRALPDIMSAIEETRNFVKKRDEFERYKMWVEDSTFHKGNCF